ncbi:hypothetical protein TNCV_4197451 [Trichonephila clavipes]|nr:hypothetical protein TNCV_4197451 [Trichonephila clavipes]
MDQLPREKDLKIINGRNCGKVRSRTGQHGMEFLGRSRPTLGCRAIEEGSNAWAIGDGNFESGSNDMDNTPQFLNFRIKSRNAFEARRT